MWPDGALSSQPDLPLKAEKGVEFTPYNRKTFYIPGPQSAEGQAQTVIHVSDPNLMCCFGRLHDVQTERRARLAVVQAVDRLDPLDTSVVDITLIR